MSLQITKLYNFKNNLKFQNTKKNLLLSHSSDFGFSENDAANSRFVNQQTAL